jgi:hypothetical protein
MGVHARKFIEENYTLEKIWKEKWEPFLNNLENEIYPSTLPLTETKK